MDHTFQIKVKDSSMEAEDIKEELESFLADDLGETAEVTVVQFEA